MEGLKIKTDCCTEVVLSYYPSTHSKSVYLTTMHSNDGFISREDAIKIRDWLNEFIEETKERFKVINDYHMDNCVCEVKSESPLELEMIAHFNRNEKAHEYCDYLNKKEICP